MTVGAGPAVRSRTGASTRRVLGLELRRSPAIGVVLVMSVSGVWSLRAATFGDAGWAGGGGTLSQISAFMGPLIATAAAWSAGREGRRQAQELLAATPRPPAQRLLMTWGATAVATLTGFLVLAATLAAAIAPAVSDNTGNWPVTWILTLLGLITCSALGFTAGRLYPHRLTPPLIGVGLFFWIGNATLGGWIAHLAPVGQLESTDATRLTSGFILPLLVWPIAITGTALVLVMARQPRWAAIGALIATVAALNLSDYSEGTDRVWYEPDPKAVAQTCTTDEPQVCVLAGHAGYLPAVTPVARESLRRAQRYLPITRAAEENPLAEGAPGRPDTLPLYLSHQSVPFSSRLRDVGEIRSSAGGLVSPTCPGFEVHDAGPLPPIAIAAAAAIISGTAHGDTAAEMAGVEIDDPVAVAALHRRVTATPRTQDDWMHRYLRAARHCDMPALTRLAQG